jgi:ATP-dependent Lon protease
MAADYGVTRNYIEWLAVLPGKASGGEVDIRAKEILDADYYDLKKVKDRIWITCQSGG